MLFDYVNSEKVLNSEKLLLEKNSSNTKAALLSCRWVDVEQGILGRCTCTAVQHSFLVKIVIVKKKKEKLLRFGLSNFDICTHGNFYVQINRGTNIYKHPLLQRLLPRSLTLRQSHTCIYPSVEIIIYQTGLLISVE